MSNEAVTKILEIKVRYDDAIKKMAEYQKNIQDAREAEKSLKQQLKEGLVSREEYNKSLSASQQYIRMQQNASLLLTRQMTNQMKVQQEQNGSLVQLRARLSSLTQEYDSLGKAERASASGVELKNKINSVTTELKEAEFATQRFYRNVGNYKDAANSLDALGVRVRNLGGIIAGAFGGLSFAGLSQQITEVGRSFNDQMAKVQAVTNATTGDFKMMREEALRLGGSTRYTATEAGEAMENLTRNGLSAADATSVLEGTLHLAQANVIGLGDAADITTNMLNSFHLGVDQVNRVNDVMSKTASSSATDILGLNEAMQNTAPIAYTLGVSFEETNAALGVLADNNVKGAQAGTMLKQIIMGLTSPTQAQAAVFAKYGIQIDQNTVRTEGLTKTLLKLRDSGIMKSKTSVKDLGDVFGRLAAPSAMTLMNSLDGLQKKLSTVSDAAGTTDRMFQQSYSNVTVSIDSLKSAFESLLITIFDSASDKMVSPLDAITEGITYVRVNFESLSEMVGTILASFSLVKIVQHIRESASLSSSSVIANAEKATANVNSLAQQEVAQRKNVEALKRQVETASADERSLIENKLTIQKAQLGETEKALHKAKTAEIKATEAAAAYASGSAWQKGMITARVAIQGFVRTANAAMKTFILTAIISLALELFMQLDDMLTSSSAEFRSFKSTIGDLVKSGLQFLVNAIAGAIKWMVNLYNNSLMARGAISALKVAFTSVWEVVKVVVKNIGNSFKLLGGIIGGAATALKGLFTLDFSAMKNGMSQLAKAVGNYFKQTWENVKQGAGNVADTFKSEAKSLGQPEKQKATKRKTVTKKAANGANVSTDLGDGKIEGGTPAGTTGAKGAKNRSNKAGENEEKRHQEEIQKIVREGEEALTKLIADNLERQRAETLNQYKNQIDDLRKKLDTDKKLTVAAKTALNNKILALEHERNEKMEALYMDRYNKMVEEDSKVLEMRIKNAHKGTEEQYKLEKQQRDENYQKQNDDIDAKIEEQQQHIAAIENEYQKARANNATELELDSINQRKDVEMAILDDYNKEKTEIAERQRQEDAQAEDDYQNEKMEKNRQIAENEIAEMSLKVDRTREEQVAILEARRDADEEYIEQLEARGQMESQTQEEYYTELLEAKQKYADDKKAIDDYEVECSKIKMEAEATVANSLIKLTGAIGESNSAFAKMSKILTLAQIAIDTGKAISAGVASASSLPFPANLAAIATTVATVLANIATAISTVNSAKFATGGIVDGHGKKNGMDQVTVRVNDGEMILNEQQQANMHKQLTGKPGAFTKGDQKELFGLANGTITTGKSDFYPITSAFGEIGGNAPFEASRINDNVSRQGEFADRIVQGVENMPAPVVAVEDINEGQRRVEVINNIDTL
ncbi:phage tail tape measure protein [Hoylesella timonensis]|uniref:Phage tail tape measure protein n=1 Tax=Hoylesella timonensis TaxID=386414 RepID=A0A2K0XPD1_9BACT|nr:phage tail tape measure protein [Hoylesella timonensis]PNP96407.1 phage tail tape measure protein [Hoylesella timonensis]